MTAQAEVWRQHSILLNSIMWRMAERLGMTGNADALSIEPTALAERFFADLAAAPASAHQPVAWQFKDSEWTEWATISEAQYDAYRGGRHTGSGNSFEIRALYTEADAAPRPACPDCKGTGGERWMEADGSENGRKCDTCDGFGSVAMPCSKCVELDRANEQLHAHGTAIYAQLTALRRALTEYPKKNPQQMQAAKVCAGVLKLAGKSGHD